MRKCLVFTSLLILLSSCSSEAKNHSLHADMSFSEAKQQGYVVSGPSGQANVDKIETFYEDYQNKKSNNITLARYTDEGDPIYIDLTFDGDEISYSYDNTWDEFGGQNKGVRKTSCTIMGQRIDPQEDRIGTEYYLTSCSDDVGYSVIEKEEYYLLFINGEK